MTYTIIVLIAFLAWVSFGPIGRQLRFGNHITKLTNIFEALEMSRRTMFIGAGGGLDSLPEQQGLIAAAQIETSLKFLKTQPRHEVTVVVLKNLRLADKMGRTLRAEAIGALLRFLIESDVALDLEKFNESYA